MKALNRAIARTTGHIIKLCAFRIDAIGTQGCAVKQTPETLKQLEQHLTALLDIEREQLAVAGIKSGHIIPGIEVVVPPVKWTPEMVAAFNGMKPVQLQPHEHGMEGDTTSALDKACEAASNFASEGARYLQQRDGLMDVLVQVSAYFETGKIRHDLDIRQVVNCALEHFRRDGVGHKETAVTTRSFVEHQTKVHAQPLPPETEANLPPKPVHWYKSGVRGIGDPGLQWTPSAASEQPPPPAPDVVDMTDPANWQEGDIVLRTGKDWVGFFHGSEYRVAKVKPGKEEIYIARDGDGAWTGYTFDILRADKMFKWLRHGEAQA